ncbi:hypothetical protein ZWY2020_030470 [Hordeum vulgare]|nr:hypothetical protein ZWY2020_030470 [Hordeum vulgare]
MGSRREEERNEKIIRGLMKLPPNRKCINCNSVGPQYVCTNFWTFTCLSCSGIHREFTHRVKSVSMAKFTTQEVRALEQGGNQRARDIYLKDWDWQRMRLPDNSKPERIREFIRTVYIDKKYAGAKSTDKPATDSESVKGNESETRRPDSYHSYYKAHLMIFSMKIDASSTSDIRNDVLSPSSQDTGYSSPSVHHSRNVSTENPQSQRHPNAVSQIESNGAVAYAPSIDLFAGFNQQTASVPNGHSDVVKEAVHNAVVQKVPAALPSGIAKAIDQSTLPNSPPSAIMSQTSTPTMDQWSLNTEEVKLPVSKENSQAWNAFGESTTGNMPNNLFAFNDMPQVAPHQFTIPSVPYVGSRTSQDLARGEPERSTPGDMFPGFNVSPGVLAEPSFPAPLQPQLGMAPQPGKSTNPFDMAFESDVEANDMFMDLTSLQATLPDPHVPEEYSVSLAEPWMSQNSTVQYIPSASQGGLSYIPGQVQDSHILNSAQQGHFPPRNPFDE